MKKIMFISLLILLLISVSAVSANDDLNKNITKIDDNNNQIEINNEDILGASSARTFMDLQGQIMKTSAGGTLTLEDDYEYTEGTDRTIGIAIYSTTKNITIDGNGHTLNGKNAARILYVNDGATNIVIKNLNFINGYNTDGAGAIFWKGESGTIINCNFTSDTADKSGGAIIWAAATGTIDNCKFEECASKAQSGGAIYTSDASTQITISNSEFISNSAKTSGAAIASAGANAAISNNVFTDNSVSDSGAAIYLSGANTKVNDCQFIRNKVDGSGGAIFWKGELGTLDNCNFTSNTAENNGGAVFWATAKGTITNNRFENSISKTQSGGAVYCSDQTTQTTISNNVFINNSAQTCGGGIGSAGASSIISNNIFTDNEVGESGAAIYTSGTKSKINNNQFLRNKAVSGGAIYIEIDEISMDRCYFEDNTITGGGGGAIRWNGNSGTMTNCEFTNNTAATRGGAIYWNGNDAKIENNNFTSNIAETAAGGALLYWGNNGQIISNNFNENTATKGYGGALYVDGTSTTVNNNEFNENIAAKGGGAIYYNGTSGTVSSNTITGNTAENACGIRWVGDTATITGNTFKGNKNNNGQNIIFGDGAKASVTKNTFINSKESDNCIRWNSADATISGNIYKEDTTTTLTGSDVTADYGESAKLVFTLTSSSKALSGKTVTVSLNNENTNLVTDSKGQVSLDVSNLNAGTYIATANFAGDSDYDSSTATANIEINKVSTKTDLTLVKELHAGDEVIITATVNATEGDVTFNVASESKTIKLTDGKATLTIADGLVAGEYDVTAQYNGGTNYLTSSDSDKFTVLINPTTMTTSNMTFYYGGKGEVSFTLADYNNTPIANAEIQVSSIDGNLNLKTDSKGKVYVKLENIEAGTYQIEATYAGADKVYIGSSATATVTAKSTIESDDLIAYYANATYTAKFIDANGTALAEGTYISFKIGNEAIRAPVDEDGSATIELDMRAGEYQIKNINTVTGESTFNNVTIKKLPTVTALSIAEKIYAGERFEIIANVNATEGEVEFMVRPNSDPRSRSVINGTATLVIPGFIAGEYNVTAEYLGGDNYLPSSDNQLFTIEMNPTTIITADTIMYHGGKGSISFNLLKHNGNPLQYYSIQVSSINENMTLMTDENGTVNLEFENLEIGEYEIKAYFPGYNEVYLNSTATATLSVKPTIESEDLIADYNNATFTARFVDMNGTPLAEGTYVLFTIDNDQYRVQVDSNGVATLTINKDHGKYNITSINTLTRETTNNAITINQVATETTLTGVKNIEVESNNTITASVNATEGIVVFNVNGTETIVNLTGGKANLELYGLPFGTYTVTATYVDEKENYLTSNASATFEVTKKKTFLTVNDEDIYYGNCTYLVVTLTDSSKPLELKPITAIIGDYNLPLETNSNGQDTLQLWLDVNNYTATFIFEGDDEYEPSNATSIIIVRSTIESENLTADYASAVYSARFLDSSGNPLAKGTEVIFTIENDVFIENITENGVATLNINKNHGTYTITNTNPVTKEVTENSITISQVATETTLSGIKDGHVGDNMTIVASVNTTEGNVIFNINGNETIFNLTDSPVSLDLLSLKEGTYTVTATYKDVNGNYLTSSANATFEVIKKATTLTAENVTMYYGAMKNLTVTLTDCESKGVAGKEINITSSRGKASDFTDENGAINETINGIEVGIFDLFISFAGDDEYEAANITVTVTILTTIESEDVIADYNNASFTAKFLDKEGNPLAKGENVTFLIENDIYEAVVEDDGIATAVIDKDHGTYTIISFNHISDQMTENNITINQVATETILTGVKDIYVGENLTLTASVNATEGSVIFNMNGNETSVNLTDGKATLEYTVPKEGTYTVTATYKDVNDNYLTSSANATFEVIKKATTLTAENVTMYYGAMKNLTVTLTDCESKGVAGKEINITSSRGKASDFTDENGAINETINGIEVGIFDLFISFAGDDEYKAANITVTVTILTTIESEDVIADYNNATFTAKFLDKEGNPLAKGENVTFLIENDIYEAVVEDDGIATAVIDKDHGTYTIISFNHISDQMTENNITINQVTTETILTGAKDINAGENLTLTASVNATEGSVTFKVNNNETVINLTDGKAELTLTGLKEGTYTVTATYTDANGNYLTSDANATFEVTRRSTVLTSEDVIMYYGASRNEIVTLTDNSSKPLAGKEIAISFSGEGFVAYTDSNGQITLFISGNILGTYTLDMVFAGDDEYKPSNTTFTVTVKTTIESENLTADYANATYTARFLDSNGTALAKGTNVTFTIANDTYTVTVEDDGTATINIKENHGTYNITVINTVTGENTTNTITINQVATATELTGAKDINTGENLTLTASVNATEGSVTFKVNDKETVINLTDGKASLDLSNIEEGTYTVTATYTDANGNYLKSDANATFKATKKDNRITVESADIKEGEDAVFNVTATAPSGKVTLSIDSKSFTQNLTDGKATFTVSNLTSGDYPYKVTFEDDFYYASNSTEGIINVKSDNLLISAPDLTKYYHGPERFLIYVTDKEGNPLENITVQIVLNGNTYNRTTNASGIAGMNINLGSSNYTALVIYAGDGEHVSVNVTSNITVLPTVFGDDVTKIQRGPEPYYATFLDSEGNYLKDGTTIQFNINGVLYDRKVSGNLGLARLNLNLEAGTYIITAMNPVTGENAANTITISPRIVNNSDVTKLYRNGTQYYVTVLGDDGKPVSGGEVTFNINGVFYTRQINGSGVARLNLNLEPGNYIITAEYNSCRVSNNITVLPVLSAKDITMTYKDGTKFKATLVNGTGAPYPGQTVTFNINGVFYDRITDNDGIAALNINLMPGKYIITSSYNGANIANTVTIKP